MVSNTVWYVPYNYSLMIEPPAIGETQFPSKTISLTLSTKSIFNVILQIVYRSSKKDMKFLFYPIRMDIIGKMMIKIGKTFYRLLMSKYLP